MESGYFAACAGLIARTGALELAANNLANANTAGFRAQHETFRSLLAASSDRQLTAVNQAVNDFGVLGQARLDLTQANLEHTGSPLDVAIEGKGFFAVQTAAGTRYTRNGNFHVSRDGYLVSNAGDRVLGDQGPVRMTDGIPTISEDGTISVDGGLSGKLKVVEFAPGTALRNEGESYYVADGTSGQPAKSSRVRQSMLEGSNVSPVAAAVGLVAIQRSAEMLQRALTVFNNDFNRIASEDLPRV